MNIKTVQALAGHSTIQVTLDIYAKAFTEDNKPAIERLPYLDSIYQEASEECVKVKKVGAGSLAFAQGYIKGQIAFKP